MGIVAFGVIIVIILLIFFACLLIGMIVFVGANIPYGFRQGIRALGLSQGKRGDDALILHSLGITLCEPLVSCLVILLLLITSVPQYNLSLLLVVSLAPILFVILTLPRLSTSTSYHTIRMNIMRLNLVRLGTVTFALLCVVAAFRDEGFVVSEYYILAGIISLVWFGMTLYLTYWGGNQVDKVLALQFSPQRVPLVAAPASLRKSQPSSLLCPICAAPTPRNASDCPACGLVFQSRVPAALHSLTDYHVLRPLGSGGMSSVYLARQHATEHLCVIKTLASVEKLADPIWHAEAARCLRQEAALLHQLDHPHIARVWEWVSNEDGGLLVLDYVPGLTLEQRLTHPEGPGKHGTEYPLPLEEVLQYGYTVATILEYLVHLPQPLVHHDIKPGNLIVREEDGVLVLVDFGGAVLVPDSAAGTVRLESYGTPGYAAPEQYRGESSPQSDIYGLGATIYHLLTADDPADHPFQFPKLALLPDDVRTMLEPTMTHNPAARPNAQTLRIALQILLRQYQ